MKIERQKIADFNQKHDGNHQKELDFISDKISKKGVSPEQIIQKIQDFQVAIPSWALGTGGTRFGRFVGVGEPRNLEEKIEDVGLIHALNRSSGAISLHIPWDIPEDETHIKELAGAYGLLFDAVNSNTFQDQPGQKLSYKFGSMANNDPAVRKLAIDHNIEVIGHGKSLGSKSLTVWLADGATFPGQQDFITAFQNTLSSLQEIYAHLPVDWKMYVEYKPYEPNFYSTVIQDWGTSYLLSSKLGEKALCLVDLGHHLPNTNIEQIVATLMMEGKLGGFHFNDSKYGDDDLTVGSIKPYQLYLIFLELVKGMENPSSKNPELSWMIDASHNVKDPLEDLMQSVEAILVAYAQALLTDKKALMDAQKANDVVMAQELVQDSFRTDVRPLIRESMRKAGGAIHPIKLFREMDIRKNLYKERGVGKATGL
jgi:L-rhamnose isomerase / sugar isomerase